jgi:hypothetical protein
MNIFLHSKGFHILFLLIFFNLSKSNYRQSMEELTMASQVTISDSEDIKEQHSSKGGLGAGNTGNW